jgi:hypothetical protein
MSVKHIIPVLLPVRVGQFSSETLTESVLKTEMAGLESQEEDDPKRILFFKSMSWLGQIRTHRRDESWSASLCQTFFSKSMVAQIPVIAEKSLTVCGCRKFGIDSLGDHLCTHSSIFATRLSLRCLNHGSHRFSPKLLLYVLILTLTGRLSPLSHILAHRIHKLLVY